ncbi:MAG: hypothetical protein IPF77_17215 [Gemmatimonadetes bacterium]|nr:hypothetical protein [Gemmatimonadota bacterium]
MRSLQRTLALRYGFTMLVALVTVALWAFLGVQRTLARQLDLALDDGADLMVDVVAKGEGLAQHAGARDLSVFLDEVNRLVVIRDSGGRVLDYNMPLANILPLDSAAFQTALHGGHAWATNDFAGRRIRSAYVAGPPRARGGAAPPAVVQVAASLRPLQTASDSLLLRLVLTALIGTLLTTAGAGWLARSSLEPVGEIAAQARAVSVRGDGHRITVHADVLELQDLIAMLNGMLQRLDAALIQQRRIISDVGHDLRTPITAMRGELEVALRTPARRWSTRPCCAASWRRWTASPAWATPWSRWPASRPARPSSTGATPTSPRWCSTRPAASRRVIPRWRLPRRRRRLPCPP